MLAETKKSARPGALQGTGKSAIPRDDLSSRLLAIIHDLRVDNNMAVYITPNEVFASWPLALFGRYPGERVIGVFQLRDLLKTNFGRENEILVIRFFLALQGLGGQ